jgi:hypothetical protein
MGRLQKGSAHEPSPLACELHGERLRRAQVVKIQGSRWVPTRSPTPLNRLFLLAGGTGFCAGRAAQHLRGYVSNPGRNRISASCLVFVQHTGVPRRPYSRSMVAATVAATRHGLKHESRL